MNKTNSEGLKKSFKMYKVKMNWLIMPIAFIGVLIALIGVTHKDIFAESISIPSTNNIPVISPLATPYQFEAFANPGEDNERWSKDRGGKEITTVVVHHMSMTDFDAIPELWRTREASAHYGIGPNGEIRAYVEEEKKAWHAKQANGYSIGIECCNITKEPDWQVSDQTIDSLVALIKDINRRYGRKMKIVGHQFAEGNSPETTDCPGPSLISRLPEIIKRVNEES